MRWLQPGMSCYIFLAFLFFQFHHVTTSFAVEIIRAARCNYISERRSSSLGQCPVVRFFVPHNHSAGGSPMWSTWLSRDSSRDAMLRQSRSPGPASYNSRAMSWWVGKGAVFLLLAKDTNHQLLSLSHPAAARQSFTSATVRYLTRLIIIITTAKTTTHLSVYL